jgi:serine/threonine protein kinase
MAEHADFVGKSIGNYRIVSLIASGAFGTVYRAQHQHLSERLVAINLLHTYIGSERERAQFVQEAQFLEKLKQSHILPILDVGFSDGFPYLISELAPNGSLQTSD